MNYSNNNVSFTSRCQSVEMARSACRKISLYSTTKRQPIISDLRYRCSEEMFPCYGFEVNKNNPLKNKNKAYRVLRAFSNCSDRLMENRENYAEKRTLTGAQHLLNLVRTTHVGNCGESAESIALILNMNGIENTYITTIKNGGIPIDHEICIFNRNGSPFDGKIKNNQTMIVDAWLGVVDFANTALKDIKSFFSKYFYINPNNDVMINSDNLAKFELSESDLKVLKSQYPEFILKKK